MATIKDVAARANVSAATVSHVINGTRKVAPETAKRVQHAMEDLEYHPNAVAQSLRTRTTHVIGGVISDITNPFFATLVRGAEDAALNAGYSLIICNSDESLEKEDHYVRLLRQRRMDGLLISPVGDGSNSVVHELPKWKIPFVFVDRRVDDIDADAVLSDNVDGAYQATRHLISQEHRRIGLILGIKGATTTEERLAGYRRALNEAGITFTEELVTYGGSKSDGGSKMTEKLLSLTNPPSAIFSTNNLMTVGVLRALVHHRISIPQGMAVVGFDDLDSGELLQPPLTVVRQNPHEIGKIAVKVLLSQFENVSKGAGDEIRIPVELCVRGST